MFQTLAPESPTLAPDTDTDTARQTEPRQGTASEPAEPRQSTPGEVAEPSQVTLSARTTTQPPLAAGSGCATAIFVSKPLPPLDVLEQVRTRQTEPRQGTASEPAEPGQSTPGEVAEPSQATLSARTATQPPSAAVRRRSRRSCCSCRECCLAWLCHLAWRALPWLGWLACCALPCLGSVCLVLTCSKKSKNTKNESLGTNYSVTIR